MSLRPSILDPLFAPANTLPGVGPKIAPLLDRLLGEPGKPTRVADLLFHLPSSGISREMKGSVEDAPAKSAPRRRLAYDELLASQLALALVRSRMRRLPGRVNAGDGRLVQKLVAALPFGLT